MAGGAFRAVEPVDTSVVEAEVTAATGAGVPAVVDGIGCAAAALREAVVVAAGGGVWAGGGGGGGCVGGGCVWGGGGGWVGGGAPGLTVTVPCIAEYPWMVQ